MKKALTAVLVLTGIIALSGTSFAEVKASTAIKRRSTTMYDTQRPPEPPREYERIPQTSGDGYGERGRHEFPDRRHPGRRPQISPDRRPPENMRPPLQQGVSPR